MRGFGSGREVGRGTISLAGGFVIRFHRQSRPFCSFTPLVRRRSRQSDTLCLTHGSTGLAAMKFRDIHVEGEETRLVRLRGWFGGPRQGLTLVLIYGVQVISARPVPLSISFVDIRIGLHFNSRCLQRKTCDGPTWSSHMSSQRRRPRLISSLLSRVRCLWQLCSQETSATGFGDVMIHADNIQNDRMVLLDDKSSELPQRDTCAKAECFFAWISVLWHGW